MVNKIARKLEEELIGHWLLDQSHGHGVDYLDKSKDRSPMGVHLDAGNGVSYASSAKTGESVLIDGNNEGLTSNYTYPINDVSTDSFSISAYAYIPSTDKDASIHIAGQGHNEGFGLQIQWNTSWTDEVQVQFGIREQGAGDHTAISGPALPTNNWYHFVGIYDSSIEELKLYIDGEIISTSNVSPASFVTTEGFGIGQRSHLLGSNVDYYRGNIDDVRLYNRTLSKEEVQYLYENPGTIGKQRSLNERLHGHWIAPDVPIQGNTIIDKAVGHHGENNGASLDTTPWGTPALSFDGEDDYVALDPNPFNDDTRPVHECSLSIWFKADSDGSETIYRIIETEYNMPGGGDDGTGFAFNYRREDEYASFYVNGENSNAGTGMHIYCDIDEWHHIVISWDGTEQWSMLNGTIIHDSEEMTTDGKINMDKSFAKIGARSRSTPSQFFKGSVADIRLYDRAITKEEGRQLYQQKGTDGNMLM